MLFIVFVWLLSIKKWQQFEQLKRSIANQQVAIFFQGGFFCFCFSCRRCFILIAMLCDCGSSRFKPPNFLRRNIVFLAIGSYLFLQIYWKIQFCIFKVVFMSIGKMLLKNDVFDSIITVSERKPLFIIIEMLSLYKVSTISIKPFEKPSFSIVLNKKGLSILSKTFQWSTCRRQNLFFFSFWYFIKSLIRNRLLKIVCCGTEQFCSFEIISSRICFKWFASIFVSILQSVHNKETGLEYFRDFIFSVCFGIKVIIACFQVVGVIFV